MNRGPTFGGRRLASRLGLAALAFALHGGAEVTEPNGVRVPNSMVPNSTETTLQAYFDSEGEGIDVGLEASDSPALFSPLCNFTATLVLSESQAAAGLAWYNVPADPTQAPDALHQVLPEAANPAGVAVSAADIRSSPDYAGGYVGFALTKFSGMPVYYSEYHRNADCTACAVPGHWKMMLAYRSNVHQSSYYIAFEDWEGANQETWFGNDGDFNDKVFLVTGVSCPGGGEPCDTGKPGFCSAGLTACSFMGEPECKQQYPESPEACDNIDNDCNGTVDDGELCAAGQVCVRGKCVRKCSTGEFRCPSNLACAADGFCIDPECLGVLCDAGLACRNGECVGQCQGVVCPLGQSCRLDRCVDPCADIDCPAGTFCDRGVCIGDCACSGCPAGRVCSLNGSCVAPGCENLVCGGGQVCREGVCSDPCDGAVCPGAVECSDGSCADPSPISEGGRSNEAGAATGGLFIVPSPATGGAASVAQGGNGGASSEPRPAAGRSPHADPSSGCGCRVAGAPGGASSGVVILAVLGLATARRASRRGRDALHLEIAARFTSKSRRAYLRACACGPTPVPRHRPSRRGRSRGAVPSRRARR